MLIARRDLLLTPQDAMQDGDRMLYPDGGFYRVKRALWGGLAEDRTVLRPVLMLAEGGELKGIAPTRAEMPQSTPPRKQDTDDPDVRNMEEWCKVGMGFEYAVNWGRGREKKR